MRKRLADEFAGDGFKLIARHLAGKAGTGGLGSQVRQDAVCNGDTYAVGTVCVRGNALSIGAEHFLQQCRVKTSAGFGKEGGSAFVLGHAHPAMHAARRREVRHTTSCCATAHATGGGKALPTWR